MDSKVVEMIRSEPDVMNPDSDPYMAPFAIVLLREASLPTPANVFKKGSSG